MKTAVIFGARQPFGFELCSRLLERGFEVYGIDHHQWITEEQEDNWLLIGRNANLRYMELEKTDDTIHQALLDERCLYIIPTLDYLNKNDNGVRNQLVSQLKRIAEGKRARESLLVIQPPSIERAQSSFIHSFNELLESVKENHRVIEYSLSSSFSEKGKNMALVEKNGGGSWEKTGNLPIYQDEVFLSDAAKDVACYIEKEKMLELNE
ncbi:NAD(P)-binding Rossmann-fold domain-containing protein [Bacillus freudenreichii]|nr:NAD(P)-binding Rossmann-fold domain-containing protein [Bacillus freudenreichii]